MPADELLERAVGYTLVGLQGLTPADLAAPTPCAGWDLRDLLEHLADSIAAIAEAAELGQVAADPARPPADPAAAVRRRAARLLGAWTRSTRREAQVAGRAFPLEVLAGVGALEIAVHGWDVACARGLSRPIPPPLAARLLPLAPLVVTPADRPTRFSTPVDVPGTAPPGDRLLAYLGRQLVTSRTS